MNEEELKAKLDSRQFPRVTEEEIKAKIDSVSYMEIVSDGVPLGVNCVIRMKNGWLSTGFSAPADPRNYDKEVGEHYAYKKAFEPLWQLEGYLLREELFEIEMFERAMAGEEK